MNKMHGLNERDFVGITCGVKCLLHKTYVSITCIMKINVLHLCAWRMALFKLDVVADWGISLLRTQLISYCWYYELQIKKFTYEISAYDTL